MRVPFLAFLRSLRLKKPKSGADRHEAYVSAAGPASWGAQPIRLIVAAGVILIAAILAAAFMLLANLRKDQLADGERDLESLAMVLAEQIDRGFQAIEVVETAVADRAKSLAVDSAGDLRRLMSGYDTHERLLDLMSGLPLIDAVVLTDADGKLVNFSRAWPIPQIAVGSGDPAHMIRLSGQDSVIGAPMRSPANGMWVLPMGRKIASPAGQFIGVVMGVMRLDYFEQLFHGIARNNDRSISLFTRDGILVARFPADEALRGKSLAHRAIFRDVLMKKTHGTVQQKSLTGGRDLLIAGRNLQHFPFAVVVTRGIDDVLAAWWSTVIYVAIAAAVIACMIGAAAFLVSRQIGLKLQAQNRHLDAALNNMSQGLAMFDPSGRLIVCNNRYLEMYDLPPEVAKPGCSLQELLRLRIAAGTFLSDSRIDPDQYVADLAEAISCGKQTSTVFELSTGRTVSIVNQPMQGGGWVATHDDITDARHREESFRLLFESNPVPMWVLCTEDFRFLAVNNATIAHYGYSREQFMTMKTLDIRPASEHERFTQSMRQGGGNHSGEEIWRHQKADGNTIDVVVYARTLRYQGRNACLVAAHDITDRQRAEEELRRTKKFLDTVIENVPVPIVVKDVPDSETDATKCRYSLANRAFEEFLGIPRSDIVGKTPYDFYPKEQADRIVAMNGDVLRSDHPVTVADHPLLSASMGMRLVVTKNVTVRDDDHKPRYLLTVIDDVTERKRVEQRIAQMALSDALTGMPNRAAFNEAMETALTAAARTSIPFAVLIVDLDGFKDVNDTYGHSVGDTLLSEVARRLQAASGDAFVARIGGDEFALIVPGSDQPVRAAAVGQRLQQALAREIVIKDRRLTVGATVGGAVFPNDGADANALMINADIALYRAKAEARGGLTFFDAAMGDKVRERHALQEDLGFAVARNEMLLHYQPQRKITGEMIGFEALIRWQCGKRGLVSPDAFIPVAEESGLITSIGEWVLREACREAASWQRPLTVAVNISPFQFRSGDLPALVHSILLETGLPPQRLELEITESVLIGDYSRAQAIICRLKALGVRIALDDFGTGYSSLSYVHAFPFDKIKIDRTFVGDLEHNQHSNAIVEAVIGLAHKLQIPILAEGVETQVQHGLLMHKGCDEVQGYLIGRPRPLAHYAELVGGRAEFAVPHAMAC